MGHSGGGFALTGGYWPEIVSAPGAPLLTVETRPAGANGGRYRVTWGADATGWRLQRSLALQSGWADYFQQPVLSGAGFAETERDAGGREFFRLIKP